MNEPRKTKKFFNLKFFFGACFVLMALLFLLIPVRTNFADACGSVIFSEKTTFVELGEIKNEVTPPCWEEHKERIKWAIPIGSIGLLVIGIAIFSGNKEDPI